MRPAQTPLRKKEATALLTLRTCPDAYTNKNYEISDKDSPIEGLKLYVHGIRFLGVQGVARSCKELQDKCLKDD